jgi:hypothetical protein
MTGCTEDGFHGVSIEPSGPNLGAKRESSLLDRPRSTVRTRFAHRLISVCGTHDPSAQGDRPTRHAARIARAIDALAMLHGDGTERRQHGGLMEHPLREIGMHSGLRADVIAEPLGLLVRIGMTTDELRKTNLPGTPFAWHEPDHGTLCVRCHHRRRRHVVLLGRCHAYTPIRRTSPNT